jgi:hypothetical protein
MLKTGSDLFIQDPARESRFLHRGRVIGVEGARCTVQLGAGALDVASQREVLVYFHTEEDFLQQVMEIGDRGADTLVLCGVGDPISADQREHERVSTLTADLAARIGEEIDCPVHDLSATGFAAVANAGLAAGQIVDVSLTFEGRCYVGRASVQSIREVGRRRVRYGLRLLTSTSGPGKPLHAELPRISLALQRSQQRSCSGEG